MIFWILRSTLDARAIWTSSLRLPTTEVEVVQLVEAQYRAGRRQSSQNSSIEAGQQRAVYISLHLPLVATSPVLRLRCAVTGMFYGA